MDLLGVGPLELVFILLIIFLILGPDDIAATGRKLGKFLNTIRKSEFWQGVNQVSKEVRTLPNKLMREAQLEETKKELEKDLSEVREVAKEFDLKEARDLQNELKEGMQVNLDEPKIAPPDVAQSAPPEQPETPTEEDKD
ncbi:MAG TPA: twin-arginine translocase TatA/TatE family subunit [Anaerolineales bacterium]|nr:twin-arginine translocase TatA/TatE family subunit [Anaerolineales bacterium]